MRVSRLPRVNIGCGRSPKPKDEGWINCDLYHGEGVDMVFDCQQRWPFDDESIMEVSSDHTLEHLSDYMAFFREAWRVLIPNGQLNLRVPYGWASACWWDFTHLRPWLQESFATLQPGFTHFTRNLQHEDLGFAFWVHQVVMVFSANWARLWRFRPLRPLCEWSGRHLLNVYKDMLVECVKTTKDDPRSVVHGGDLHPAVVPCAYGVMEHEYYGRSGNGLPYHRLIVFAGKAPSIAGHG